MIKIGLVGFGYWGKNLLRNFLTINNCIVEYIIDTDLETHKSINHQYPRIKVSKDIHEVLNNKEINAIVISSPSSTHFQIAKEALLLGKHVLIEKPMTLSVKEGEELIDIASSKNLIISVDHTFLYTPALSKIKSIIQDAEFGKVKFFDSTRINLGIFQSDVNVLWDLAVHDISILNYLIEEKPISIRAVGVCHTNNALENIAYIVINYHNDFIAHLNCSWSSPVKIRMMLIGGENKTLLFNDLDPVEKVKIYNASYKSASNMDRNKTLIDYRTGDVFVPKLDNTEALSIFCNEFVNCILNNTQPISNAVFSLEVVRILEAANTSIKNGGELVLI